MSTSTAWLLLSAAAASGCGQSAPHGASASVPAGGGAGGALGGGPVVAVVPNSNAGRGTSEAAGGGGSSGSGGSLQVPKAGNPIALLDKEHAADYYPELLQAEGISSFDRLSLSMLGELPRYQVAILAPVTLDTAEVEVLTTWVNQGGRLLALRPDDKLAAVLGIGPSEGRIADGYLKVSRARWGISESPLQFHGGADLHVALPGTAAEGQLFEGKLSQGRYPVISLRENIGAGSGKAAALMFDLARSVILTRQGDPARAAAGPRLDSVARASEFFDGFLDMDNFLIPQADEQQRLFVRLLHELNGEQTPLPRFWYLPGGRRVAVVMTGDDHNAQGTVDFFNTLKSTPYSPPGCSASNWSCARATSWVYSGVTGLKNGAGAGLVSEGFELGPHVALERDGGCADWSSFDDLLTRFSARQREFVADYGMPASATNRTHCFVFSDWDTQTRVEQQLGIRLDENYTPYALPGAKNRLGRMNGSALPMRFTSESFATLDVFQLTSDMDYEYFDAGTSRAQMASAIGALLDSATGPDGFWGFVGTHFDYSGGAEGEFRAALLAEILKRKADGVAMISARQLLDWLDLRNGSTFHELSFDGQTLRFQLSMPSTPANPGLEAMLPERARGKTILTIRRGTTLVTAKRTLDVRGVSHIVFDAQPGGYEVLYQ